MIRSWKGLASLHNAACGPIAVRLSSYDACVVLCSDDLCSSWRNFFGRNLVSGLSGGIQTKKWISRGLHTGVRTERLGWIAQPTSQSRPDGGNDL